MTKVLNFFTLLCSFLSILSVFRSPTLTLLHHLGSLDTLRFDCSLSGFLSPGDSHTSSGVVIFVGHDPSFFELSTSSLDPYSDNVGVNVLKETLLS